MYFKSCLNKVFFFLFLALLLIPFGSDASTSSPFGRGGNTNASKDAVTTVICNVIKFVQKLGVPIMTGVIIGSSIMAIFGRLPWTAMVMLIAFMATFFGATTLMAKFANGLGADIENAESCE